MLGGLSAWAGRIKASWLALAAVVATCGTIAGIAEKHTAISDAYKALHYTISPPKLPELTPEIDITKKTSKNDDDFVHFFGIFTGDNSQRPRVIFEQALAGRIRLLIINDTGRKIDIAAAEATNGYPHYPLSRSSRHSPPVYVPTLIVFQLKECEAPNEFLGSGENRVVQLCPSGFADFDRFMPESGIVDQNDCALNVHFVTSDGIRIHNAFKLSCYALRDGFPKSERAFPLR